jgi:glucosylglycerate synthase
MKIVAIIPTLNEAENIEFITKIIDKGLKRISGKPDVTIINTDSGSTDQTQKIFLATKTCFPKKAISCTKGNCGKGRNVYEALRMFHKSADYYLMFDADVTSVKIGWINKLLNPLLNHKTDLVMPIYKRNRYEGNTTNHFSSPIIYSCLGKYIAQPIAGDFAFTKRLANMVYKSFLNSSDYGYGVDTLITWTALLNNLNISQVKLGKKIHKPSFAKIIPMFQEVSNTTFNLVNKNRLLLVNNLSKKPGNYDKDQIVDDKFIHKPTDFSLEVVTKYIEANFQITENLKFINKSFILKIDKIHTSEWSETLSDCLFYILNTKISKPQLSKISSAFTILYLKRVLGYFEDINNLNAECINKLLLKQRKLVRKNVLEKYK